MPVLSLNRATNLSAAVLLIFLTGCGTDDAAVEQPIPNSVESKLLESDGIASPESIEPVPQVHSEVPDATNSTTADPDKQPPAEPPDANPDAKEDSVFASDKFPSQIDVADNPPPAHFDGDEQPADAVIPEKIQRLRSLEYDKQTDQYFEAMRTYPSSAQRKKLVEGIADWNEDDAYYKKALPHLRAALLDPSHDVRLAASSKAAKMYWKTDLSVLVPELAQLLQSKDETILRQTFLALKSVGPSAAPAVPHLRWFIHHGKGQYVREACLVLAEIGPAAKAAVPDLKWAIDQSSSYPIHGGYAALAALGHGDTLFEGLRHDDSTHRDAAIEATARLPGHSPEVVEALTDFAESSNYLSVREAGCKALSFVRPTTDAVAATLIAGLKDEKSSLRKTAAVAIGNTDPKLDACRNALLEAMKDDDKRVVEASSKALSSFPNVEEALFKNLMVQAQGTTYFHADPKLLQNVAATMVTIAEDTQRHEIERAVAFEGLWQTIYEEETTDGQKEKYRALAKSFLKDDQPIHLRIAAVKRTPDVSQVVGSTKALNELSLQGLEQCKLLWLQDVCLDKLNLAETPEAAAKVIAIAGDPDNKLCHKAVMQLKLWNKEAAEFVPVAVKNFDRYDSKTTVLDALAAIGTYPDLSVPLCEKYAGDKDSQVRYRAIVALSTLVGQHDMDAGRVLEIIKTQLSDDSKQLSNASTLVKPLGHTAAPLTEFLATKLEGIQAKDQYVVMSLASALGSIGPQAADSVPVLLAKMKDAKWQAEGAIIEAISNIGKGGTELAPRLNELLDDVSRRQFVMRAVAKLGPDAAATVPRLTTILDSENNRDRYYAILALAPMGKAAHVATPKLKEIATSDSREAEKAALALLRLHPADNSIHQLCMEKIM